MCSDFWATVGIVLASLLCMVLAIKVIIFIVKVWIVIKDIESLAQEEGAANYSDWLPPNSVALKSLLRERPNHREFDDLEFRVFSLEKKCKVKRK